MIEKRIQTLVDFRVICDVCQRAAPESPVREEALTQAMEAGFQVATRWNGLEYIEIHLCPDCQQAQTESAAQLAEDLEDHQVERIKGLW